MAHGQKKQNKYQERKKRNNFNSEWDENVSHNKRGNGSAKKRPKLNNRNYENYNEDDDE